jgi:sugar lactone lactonase YvrE
MKARNDVWQRFAHHENERNAGAKPPRSISAERKVRMTTHPNPNHPHLTRKVLSSHHAPLDTPFTIKSVDESVESSPETSAQKTFRRLKSRLKSFRFETLRKIGGRGGVAAILLTTAAAGQGILTVTPGRTVSTTAGNGAVGYTGDGAAALNATLAYPSAVAYDASGNLYLADANNHVIREIVKSTGNIVTIAGTGVEGFSGDGASATAAQLDTPTGIAVDKSGNVYIADSHNHRIREVSGGTITTIAGTGIAGFSGDSGAAAAAQLALPSAVAVDANSNIYIADTNNHRIRKITGTTITTIAGDGEELFAGDGAAATAAALDSPTGVAVDSSGNVYIADRLNQRIREVTVSSGTITTLAGSGSGFSGNFSGDGATATAATLARPSGVSVDAAGNVYVADTDNQRIRQIGGGAIATISGTGSQGFGGDGGLATGAILNSPKSVTPDASGNISIADKQNERIRAGLLPTLTFANVAVGVPSASQAVTLANSGTASITVSTITFAPGYSVATGGSCSSLPITIAAGASCTENVEFLPVAVGADNGSVAFGGTGVVPQSVLLAATASQATTTTSLTSSIDPTLAGQGTTFTAVIMPIGLGTPTGTVSFNYLGAPIGGAPVPLVAGTASISTNALPTGTDGITAVYSGDPNYGFSNSLTVSQSVQDFSITLTPQPGNPAGSTNQTVIPGQAVTFDFALTPLAEPFTFPITMSATGLPPGATAIFKPQTVTPGGSATGFTMTVQTILGALPHENPFGKGSGVVLAMLLLPFSARLRRRARKLRLATLVLALFVSVAALGSITGCGTNTGFFGQQQKDYTITVTGTATGTNGFTLQHSTTVVLTVQ